MINDLIPRSIPNWIDGRDTPALSGEQFDKLDPSNGQLLCRASRSHEADVDFAVEAAKRAQPSWAETPAVQRGIFLHKIVIAMQQHQSEIASIVAAETGKSYKDAFGEAEAAIRLGLFFASEGQRMYGRTTTSSIAGRYAMTVRQPIGVAGLIIAANTPIANVAWKVFPALVCGNSAVLKTAEDTPATAWIFAKMVTESGLPQGVLNVIHGYGDEAGEPLVAHSGVGVISFTGSTAVGRRITRIAGERFARISLELGGKNPFVVCDDADLENASRWALLSAFSNAGQRCASASRIIVFDSIYENFRSILLQKTNSLKVGIKDDDDLGPVINEKQLMKMLSAIETARNEGADVLAGGERLTDPAHKNGFFMKPTLIENTGLQSDISRCELFGPIAILYRAKTFTDALQMANDSPYGLTACIHTKSLHRAGYFCDKVQAGVAIVNAGTYGSEPHMPFGGRKQSGNGSREPGTEALDVYSELKDIYINIDTAQL